MADVVLHASDAGASPQASSNIRHLSRTELPGGGQIVIQGHHAYVGHQNGPEGTTILDVSDPRKPKIVSQLMVPNELTHTHKVRVVGDLMAAHTGMVLATGRDQGRRDQDRRRGRSIRVGGGMPGRLRTRLGACGGRTVPAGDCRRVGGRIAGGLGQR